MKVLIDSSVWVAYFRGVGDLTTVDWLIEEELIVINDLILAELTPPLLVRGERKLVGLLREIKWVPLTLDWGENRRDAGDMPPQRDQQGRHS